MRNCRTRASDPHASNPSGSSVPESSPVAEANSSAFLHFAGLLLLMPGTLREIQTSCPACHFAFSIMRKVFPALDGFSFIPPDRPECKGMFTNLVRGAPGRYEMFRERPVCPDFPRFPLSRFPRPQPSSLVRKRPRKVT